MPFNFNLNGFVIFVTLGFAWWRFVRFTRTNRQWAIQDLENTFWINHSLDLEIPAGMTETEIATGNKTLHIRGLEVYEHGWWVQRDAFGTDGYEGWNHRLGAYSRIGKRYLKKAQYYLTRNLLPFAGLDLECAFLVETDNCRITTMEDEIEGGDGIRGMTGRTISEAFPEIYTFRQIDDNLYRIWLDTHDSTSAVEVFNRLAGSDFVKDLRE